MLRTLITTSHRPTKATRRFVKTLSLVIPNSIRLSRGKYTMNALALQAVDLNVENVIIIRNRKGNPGYIDVYSIDVAGPSLTKVCSIRICGYKIVEKHRCKTAYDEIILLMSNLVKVNINEYTLTCILKCFNINIVSSKAVCRSKNVLEAYIRVFRDRDNVYELSFSNCKGELKGLVLKICPTKIVN